MKNYTVEEDGFYGHVYDPKEDLYEGKTLLLLGGGGVPYSFTQKCAELFSSFGISTVSIGYFGVKGTPKALIQVPVEYVEEAVKTRKAEGYTKVFVAGISKGAELALLSGSLLHHIDGVMAFSPCDSVCMGIAKDLSWVQKSSWTFRGRALPFAWTNASIWKTGLLSLKKRELTFLDVYENALMHAGEETRIKVEKCRCPLLLVSAEHDSLWPSKRSCERMVHRLQLHSYAYPYKHLNYPYASHLLLPFKTGSENLFEVYRKHPKECEESIADLRREVEEWLQKN